MNVTGLDLLFLEVNNLEESLAFYHDELGFQIESNNPENDPPMATLSADRLKLHWLRIWRRCCGVGGRSFSRRRNVDGFTNNCEGRLS